MSDMIAIARKRLEELEQEVETLRQFLESAKAAEAILNRNAPPPAKAPQAKNESVDESADPIVTRIISGPLPEKPRRTRVTDNPKPAVLIPEAIKILRERGHPMSRRELHEALKERGLEVKGSDEIKALGTILWRAKKHIVQLEGYGYWPKDDEYAPAGYLGVFGYAHVAS